MTSVLVVGYRKGDWDFHPRVLHVFYGTYENNWSGMENIPIIVNKHDNARRIA